MRKAEIRMDGRRAGVLEERDRTYAFMYDDSYLDTTGARAISLSLPLQTAAYRGDGLDAKWA